jgi:hypothetical protein
MGGWPIDQVGAAAGGTTAGGWSGIVGCAEASGGRPIATNAVRARLQMTGMRM